MLGAIIGDIVGSFIDETGECSQIKDGKILFDHGSQDYSDDTVMTCAVADAVMKWDDEGRPSMSRLSDLAETCMRKWGLEYPKVGYGLGFSKWLTGEIKGPYNSDGDGSAMRVSPVAWAARTLDECIAMSRAVTEITHNHPDGIMGAEATAMQIFCARQGRSLKWLKYHENENYYPVYGKDLEYYKSQYYSTKCRDVCPAAFECLYSSDSFESAISNVLSLGSGKDSDTIGAICGSIAEAVYDIPQWVIDEAMGFLPQDLTDLIMAFDLRYMEN